MELLTIAEIAKRLELPESTVRYYRNRFAAFIPVVGEGRGRRYRPEALDVLRFIADALRSGAPAEDVETALQARFPMIIEPQQQSAATQQQSAAVLRELIADSLRFVAEEAVAPLEKALQNSIAETATLRKMLAEQQQQTAAAKEEATAAREAVERMRKDAERQHEELRAWLAERLPTPQAKRLGLLARMREMLSRDRR